MKVIARNRRASHDYAIEDRLTAGLSLAGHEVKSVRAGHVSLKGSFVHLHDGEAWLANAHIRQYRQATQLTSYEPTKPRKLLLRRKEIDTLTAAKQAKGLSVIPLAIGLVGRHIKLEIGLGRGLKRYDKRALAREKAIKRDAILDTK